jgi:hypothetical protein
VGAATRDAGGCVRGVVAKRLRTLSKSVATADNEYLQPRTMLKVSRYFTINLKGEPVPFPYFGTIRAQKNCARWHYKRLKRHHRRGGDTNLLIRSILNVA